MYKVTLSGGKEGQVFKFTNYDDAFNFASMAVEHGTVQNDHWIDMDEGVSRLWDDPVPMAVTIVGVDD